MMQASTDPLQTLQALTLGLDQLQEGALSATGFAQLVRLYEPTISLKWPPQFAEVLNQLVDRLESGALFTEESCSFSQSDLHKHLQVWLKKAQQSIGAV